MGYRGGRISDDRHDPDDHLLHHARNVHFGDGSRFLVHGNFHVREHLRISYNPNHFYSDTILGRLVNDRPHEFYIQRKRIQAAYAWVEDANGNISASSSTSVTITIPAASVFYSVGQSTSTNLMTGSPTVTIASGTAKSHRPDRQHRHRRPVDLWRVPLNRLHLRPDQ